MRYVIVLVICLVALSITNSAVKALEPGFEDVLRFEVPPGNQELPGWGGGPPETIHRDTVVVHGGEAAVRLQRDKSSAEKFSTITKRIPIDFQGESIEMRGYLRLEGVTKFVGLWMRQDSPEGVLEFDNMQNQSISGTKDWAEYSIRLPIDDNATYLVFGVLISGEGTLWVDDLELLVDGKPIREAPERVKEITVLDTDQEFTGGSGITVSSLTTTQIENVAVLGLVWGFLKYHHPRVAGGELHWDFELFRILPAVLETADRSALNHTLTQWVDAIGVPESCDPCAEAPTDAHLLPPIDWIRDTALLGPELSGRLQTIHKYRFSGTKQFYVSHFPNVRNPVFDAELDYMAQQPPDAGYRILAVLRLWNIIEYWFPYRDQLDDDWPSVLREFLPRLVEAADWDAYRLELLAFVARIGDTHANLWGALDMRPPRGNCYWPVEIRFIDGRPTVTSFTHEEHGPASGLEIGDVIEVVDGRPVDDLIEAWAPYYCASNQPRRLNDIARSMPRGDCDESELTIRRDSKSRTVKVARVTGANLNPVPRDRAGDTFQLLSPEIAYLKLTGIRNKDISGYIKNASGTTGLVIDIRNYPSEFVVFGLGSRLVRESTAFARFTKSEMDNPGAFTWTESLVLQPATPGYDGKIAILVDEVSISQAEYTAMALRAGPRAVVVGSTTAGADGNVSKIPLPGGVGTAISGIGVFYPDKTPTQRVGIIPDITATPTIDGIREGRDEVLEAALRHLLGPEVDEVTIRRMAAWN
jgi:C-terminal processing protease CtpA/Prc